ncbi:MAG TPA: gamma-glutamyltransferase [Longimicrobiaceae bacterium]|nr:gamma-glutamyltransferase [Longimicrobiaceae bacterium]
MSKRERVPRPWRSRDDAKVRWVAFVGTALFLAGCAGPPPSAIPVPTAVSPQAGQTVRTGAGVIVSANEIASRIGAGVLAAGGNAVDAAIATGFALAVVHPAAGNIGGGGFMVIRHPDGRATTFDFREKAPLTAHPEMFVDERGEYSRRIQANTHLAVGVPGTVAGFALAHERYGRYDWSSLVEPAVALAGEGFILSDDLAYSLAAQVRGGMQPYPASVAAFSRNGEPYAVGEVWRQPDLARTLERIMREGRHGFYRGETARLIREEMERGNGVITEEDLARYEAQEREPVRGTYRGYEVISMSPPSSGGVALVQMLNILEGFDLRAMGHGGAAHLHHVTEAQRLAYRDRARFLADPDFVPVPVDRLTSKEYAAELRTLIAPNRAGVSSAEDVAVPAESNHTTHYSVVDAEGMAVSVTYTLEASYGSKITVTGAGFLLNNEMGDFNPWPDMTTEAGQIGTEPNLARPEQRMLSSMTPTILARDGGLAAIIGSPGGRTIINTVLHLALNIAEFEMDPEDAIAAPRSHHQWLPDRITIEERHGRREVARELEAMGHRDVRVEGVQGQAHSIVVDRRTGARVAIPDPRSADAGAAAEQ